MSSADRSAVVVLRSNPHGVPIMILSGALKSSWLEKLWRELFLVTVIASIPACLAKKS